MKTKSIVLSFVIAALLLVSQNLKAQELVDRADYPPQSLSDSQVINKFEEFHKRAETWKNLKVITAIDSTKPTFGDYSWAQNKEFVWGRGFIDDSIGNVNSLSGFNKLEVKYKIQYKNWYSKEHKGWPYDDPYIYSWYSSSHPLYRVTAEYVSAYSIANYHFKNNTCYNLFKGGTIYLQRHQETTGIHKGEFKYWAKRFSKDTCDLPTNEYDLNPVCNPIPTTFSLRAFYDAYFALINVNESSTAQDLLLNIKNGADNIMNNYYNINGPNGVANQIYAICGAYRATGNFNYLNSAIINADNLLSTLDSTGNFTKGNNKDLSVGHNIVVYHDSFIQYQALSLRALIEVYSLIANNHPLKPKFRKAIILCLNHILMYRLADYNNGGYNSGKFRYTYNDINNVYIQDSYTSYIGSEYTLQALIMAEKYLDLSSNDKNILEKVTATVFMKMELNDVSLYNKTYISAMYLVFHSGKNFDSIVNNINVPDLADMTSSWEPKVLRLRKIVIRLHDKDRKLTDRRS